MFNLTVKNFITFGQEYDQKRFFKVIEATDLIDDIEKFDNGIDTEISEKGANLSGG